MSWERWAYSQANRESGLDDETVATLGFALGFGWCSSDFEINT